MRGLHAFAIDYAALRSVGVQRINLKQMLTGQVSDSPDKATKLLDNITQVGKRAISDTSHGVVPSACGPFSVRAA